MILSTGERGWEAKDGGGGVVRSGWWRDVIFSHLPAPASNQYEFAKGEVRGVRDSKTPNQLIISYILAYDTHHLTAVVMHHHLSRPKNYGQSCHAI